MEDVITLEKPQEKVTKGNTSKIDPSIPYTDAIKPYIKDGILTSEGLLIFELYAKNPETDLGRKKLESGEPICNLLTGETVSEVSFAASEF